MSDAKTNAAAEALRAVIRLSDAADRRYKEQVQDTMDAVKNHGGQGIVNEYRYLFRNEAERDGYCGALRAINAHDMGGVTFDGVLAGLTAEIDGITRDLLWGVGTDQNTCPVKNAMQAVKAQATLGVLDNLKRIKLELEEAAAA